MSQFANTPQSFFYGNNRLLVNTATATPPNPYFTGGSNFVAAQSQSEVQPSAGKYYYLRPFNAGPVPIMSMSEAMGGGTARNVRLTTPPTPTNTGAGLAPGGDNWASRTAPYFSLN
jgi:hypothetical protein